MNTLITMNRNRQALSPARPSTQDGKKVACARSALHIHELVEELKLKALVEEYNKEKVQFLDDYMPKRRTTTTAKLKGYQCSHHDGNIGSDMVYVDKRRKHTANSGNRCEHMSENKNTNQ